MFTGLIETIGVVRTVERGNKSLLFGIVPTSGLANISIGDSIAINGVCLTIEKINDKELYFRAVEETVLRSMLSQLQVGSNVNMERALLANARLDGHMVQGHVDGLARVSKITPRGDAQLYTFVLPEKLLKYVAEKGSVALNGISLTVTAVSNIDFTVSIIPHTVKMTTLQELQVGVSVNFECDVLARYVERLLGFAGQSSTNEIQNGNKIMSLLERNDF